MIRMAGLMGLILASGLVGIMKAEELRLRIRLLEDVQDLVLELKSQMSYFREPLPVIFRKLVQNSGSKAFELPSACVDAIDEKDAEIGEIWALKAREMYRTSPLTADDMEILCHMGTYLGQTDYEHHKLQFQYTEERLARQLADARHIYLQKGSMYQKTGFFIGIIVALVLL